MERLEKERDNKHPKKSEYRGCNRIIKHLTSSDFISYLSDPQW